MEIKPQFIAEKQGRRFALYAGLLDAAHEDEALSITTELVQIGNDENGQCYIMKAFVNTSKGCFTGYGDASPVNVSRPMLTCLLRMAETRAKARALRDAVNAAALLLEGDLDDDLPDFHPEPQRAAPVEPQRPPASAAPAERAPTPPPPVDREVDDMEKRLYPHGQPKPPSTLAELAERQRGAPAQTGQTKQMAEAWDAYRARLKTMRELGYKVSALGENATYEQIAGATKVFDGKIADHHKKNPSTGRAS